MKSFKKFLTESVSKPESVQRLIYSQPPSPHDEPLYNQIVTRPTQPNFSWKATDRKIDPVVQASWADPRKGLVEQIHKLGANKAFDLCDVKMAERTVGMWSHTNVIRGKFDMFPQQELVDMLLSL